MSNGSLRSSPRGKCVRVRLVTGGIPQRTKDELRTLGATVLPLFWSTKKLKRSDIKRTHAIECCYSRLSEVTRLLSSYESITIADRQIVMPYVEGVQWMSASFVPFEIRKGQNHQVPHYRVCSLEKAKGAYILLVHQILDDKVEVEQIQIEESNGKMNIPFEVAPVRRIIQTTFGERRGIRISR